MKIKNLPYILLMFVGAIMTYNSYFKDKDSKKESQTKVYVNTDEARRAINSCISPFKVVSFTRLDMIDSMTAVYEAEVSLRGDRTAIRHTSGEVYFNSFGEAINATFTEIN